MFVCSKIKKEIYKVVLFVENCILVNSEFFFIVYM